MIFMCCKTNSVGFKTSLAEGLMLSGEEGALRILQKRGPLTKQNPHGCGIRFLIAVLLEFLVYTFETFFM